MTQKKGLILDRDGTLIDIVRDDETGVVFTAFHPDQLRLLPGVVEGLLTAQKAGFALAVATNQPAPAKGQAPSEAVTRTNDALVAMLRDEGITIEAVACCMHHPEGGPGGDPRFIGPCRCRKPLPGMIDDLVHRLDLDRARSWIVGDTATDVQAGSAAGVRTALVFAAGRCELCPLRAGPSIVPELHAATFDAVVDAILTRLSVDR